MRTHTHIHTHDILRVNQDEVNNLNKPVISKEVEEPI